MNKQKLNNGERESRIESFSDNIFGVAITLLGIDIGLNLKGLRKVCTDSDLWSGLLNLWPQYFAYFNSFISVLLMWMMHHRIFKLLGSTNVIIQLFNGLLLLTVALVPFPTKTVSQYLNSTAIKTAVVFYCGYYVLVGIAFICLCLAIRRHRRLLLAAVSLKFVDKMIFDQLRGLFLNISITILAFFYPAISLAGTFGMWFYWIRLIMISEK